MRKSWRIKAKTELLEGKMLCNDLESYLRAWAAKMEVDWFSLKRFNYITLISPFNKIREPKWLFQTQ